MPQDKTSGTLWHRFQVIISIKLIPVQKPKDTVGWALEGSTLCSVQNEVGIKPCSLGNPVFAAMWQSRGSSVVAEFYCVPDLPKVISRLRWRWHW